MKHYLTSQASLEMAHRNPDSELVGRIYSQQLRKMEVDNSNTPHLPNVKDADTYNPNHPQIVRFYRKWGKRE